MEEKKNPLDIAEDIIVVGMESHTTEVQEKLMKVQRKMLKEGMHNGSHGIVMEPDMLESRAEAQAESCFNEMNVLIIKKLGELETQDKYSEVTYRKSKASLMTILRDLEYFKMVKYNFNHSQGWIATWSYLFFGIFLILADIALALQLIMVGFIFPPPPKEYGIENLMTMSFFYVVKANWQVFFTTIGIATFTIILKLIFDRFIGSPYGDAVVKRSRFVRWFNKDNMSSDADDKDYTPTPVKEDVVLDLKKIRRFERVKNGTLIGLMVLTIAFLSVLSKFRSNSMDTEQFRKEQTLKTDSLSKANADLKLFDQAQKADDKKVYDSQKESKSNRIMIFFGTTLLFPIVSAICLSVADTSLENERKIRNLKKEAILTKTTLEEDQGKYGTAHGEYKAWSLELELLKKDPAENFKKKLIYLYNYGFNIGKIRPDLFQNIPNLLTTIERYRDKSVLFKTNQNLNRFTNEDK